MHQRSVLVCRHWYGSFGCRICYWSVASLAWTGQVDVSQELGVRREQDAQVVVGRSRRLWPSSLGWSARVAHTEMVQQFTLVDRFDLSDTLTLRSGC